MPKGKTILCYDLRDVLWVSPKNSKRIKEGLFGKIMRTYFQKMQDFLFEYQEAELPNGFGSFKLKKIIDRPYVDAKTGELHIPKKQYDWVAMRKFKKETKLEGFFPIEYQGDQIRVMFNRYGRRNNLFRNCTYIPSIAVGQRLGKIMANKNYQTKYVIYK